MRPTRLWLAVLIGLLLASTGHAQDGTFGAPAMLPLPSSLSGPAAGYLQPEYPPGLLPGHSAYIAPQPVYAPVYMPVQPVYVPIATPPVAGVSAPTAAARYEYAPAAPGIPAPNPNVVTPAAPQMQGYPPESQFQEALSAPCGACASCGNCGTCCGPVWFGALGGMVLTRNNPNPVWTSALVSNNFDQVLNTVDAMDSWRAGGEVVVGRRLCCGQAWAVTWWTIAPFQAFASVSDPGNLLTPIDLFGVNIGGAPATDFFDNADEHRIWRRDTFQNVELNWYSAPVGLPGRPCTLTWLTGLRYFQFNEGVIFGSVAGGNTFGSDGGIHEAYINSQVRNRLLGVQVGAVGNYFFRPRLSLFAVPKFGIYNNWAHEDFQVYRGDGLNAMTVRENANLVAFLSELDLGLNWAVTPRCSFYGGYRVLFVNGVALADNQFPHFLIDTPEIAHIKPNGNLVLHGVLFGVQWVF